MGNSNSHSHQIPIGQWTQSYPRLKHGQPQVKVLPERAPPLQLRSTDNGAILQNGGTISCRKQSIAQEEKTYRRRSTSAHRPPKPKDLTLEKSRFGSEPDLRFHLKESKDQFSDNAIRQRISRSRKKYKAPPAPQNGMSSGVESSSSDLNGWEANRRDCANGGACRKGRLFKTRAETHKKNMTNLKTTDRGESELSKSTEALNAVRPKLEEEKCLQSGERPEKKGLKRSASQEVISTRKSLATPEFQAELLEAAQRLRPSGVRRREHAATGKAVAAKAPPVKDEVFTTLKIDIPEGNNVKSNKKIVKVFDSEESAAKSEKSEQRLVRAEGQREKGEREVPFRKFYFGMKDDSGAVNVVNNSASTNNVDKTNAEHRLTAVEKSKNLINLYKSVAEGGLLEWEEDTVDKFAASFHKAQMSMANGNTTSCSSSFVSDPDEDVDGGIALQLRPTLPKKQLEIPRFSPTAAWRLLSSIDTCSQAPSPGGSDDGPLLLEDRIRPPVQQPGLRSGNDKSGDSGISGDASPGGCHESSSEVAAAPAKAIAAQNPKNLIMTTWTPQQDLEEESSSDDLESPLGSSKKAVCQIPGARFSPRGQLFLSRDQSLTVSIPREDRMGSAIENGDYKERNNAEPKLNSLRKLKAALGTGKRGDAPDERAHCPNDNWVLSRSVPSSLNSHAAITRSVSNPSSPEQDDACGQQASSNYPSYSYLANGGRIMYLPEYHSKMCPDVAAAKPRTRMGNGFLSKSCENISQPEMKQLQRSRSPSPLTVRSRNSPRFQSDDTKSTQRRKKFTFQSTVRLLENRRIAERLSREAELKESQRLCEVEAMKKVEEEFQRKRAREKANIRHQLRLFSLEEKNFSSLPPIEWDDQRGDPDCAPSSLPQIPQSHKHPPPVRKSVADFTKFTPTTQVLSEFREPTRDYKDYRHSRYHEPHEFPAENNRKFVVEHPKVVYDMPKSTAVYVSAPANTSGQSQSKDGGRTGLSPPRASSSDNYRKDFAHGALPNGGRSLTSSDSELSQSHPRPSSRQELPFRGFSAARRSRSASPESATASASPPRGSDSSCHSLRSQSPSPVKSFLCETSPRATVGANGGPGDSILSMQSLDRKPSSCTDRRSKVTESGPEDGNMAGKESFGKGATDSLVRLGLPSLQPFNRAEKSFRPINFSPVINKLAQIVT